jgi:proteasome-associated ATPase
MSREKIKNEIETAFNKGTKLEVSKIIERNDVAFVSDVIWELCEESNQAKNLSNELQDLKSKILILQNKSGFRSRVIKLLPERKALVQVGPIKEEVLLSPDINTESLKIGTEVLLVGGGDGRILAKVRNNDIRTGKIIKIKRVLQDNRAIIEENGVEYIVNKFEDLDCNAGDEVRFDTDSQMILEVISEKKNSYDYELHDIPNITLDNVKGLKEEKKLIYERIIYPAIHKEKFEKYGIETIHGAIFYGPSGCGKTFLASAIFNEMKKLREISGSSLKVKSSNKGFFIINGPETLSMWSGETERAIRSIFSSARAAAKEIGFPAIIVWDEIDSVAGKRKNVSTYTPEKTIIPTLLAEIHGVEENKDVILIGTSNRPELIDSALMRPGRLGDLILEIPRPDKEAAKDILLQALTRKEVPEKVIKLINSDLIEQIASHIYDNSKPLATANLNTGEIKRIFRNELTNGALYSHIGEEIIRKSCLEEINNVDEITIEYIVKMIDDTLLRQVGILDQGAKLGFEVDFSNFVTDVTAEN